MHEKCLEQDKKVHYNVYKSIGSFLDQRHEKLEYYLE